MKTKTSFVVLALAASCLAFLSPRLSAEDSPERSVIETVSRDGRSAELAKVAGKDGTDSLTITYSEESLPSVGLTEGDLKILCASGCAAPVLIAPLSGGEAVDLKSSEGLELIRKTALRKGAQNPETSGAFVAKLDGQLQKKIQSISSQSFFDRVNPRDEVVVMGGYGRLGQESAFEGSIFYRMPIESLTGSYGHVGVSAGVGYLSAGSKTDTLASEKRGVSYCHDGTCYSAEEEHSVKRDRPGTSLFELARVDYQTPSVNGVNLYAGVGAGYGKVDTRTSTIDSTQVTYRDGNGTSHTDTLNSKTLDSGPGETWSGLFATAFVGAQMRLKQTACAIMGEVLCFDSVKIEYERTLGREEISSRMIRLGVGFDF